MTTMIPTQSASLPNVLPFWLSLALVPVSVFGALAGGWAVLLMPLGSWGVFIVLDALTGLNMDNADPATPDAGLYWHRLITLIWFPVQFGLLVWLLWYVPQAAHLGTLEKITIFFGMGIVSGTIGINYSHELMHQKPLVERWMADLLLASVLYSHFRSEHLRVHHLYVGTPRDPVTARYNEGFQRFFPRVLVQCYRSAWQAEVAMLARRNFPAAHRSNPFWRYAALQIGFLVLAVIVGGWIGLGLFL